MAEAVRALSQIESLKRPDGTPWPVVIDHVENEFHLFGDYVLDELHIRLRTGGAGGGDKKALAIAVVIGIATVGIGLAVGAGTILGTGITGHMLALSGGMMLISGLLSQTMGAMPSISMEQATPEGESNYFGNLQNTVKIGTPIPLIYGYQKVAGHYLSYDLDTIERTIPTRLFKHDTTPLADGVGPMLPRFRSQTASPDNIPESGLDV